MTISKFKSASASDLITRLLAIAAIAAIVVTLCLSAIAQTPASGSGTKVENTTQTTSEKAEPLSGAELWTMNCNRCHMARNPAEFTAAQWRTIIRHMRVRANLPAYQARQIQKYLEGGAGK